MREISEYTLLGNYLVILSDKLGVDSIKYEVAKSLTERTIAEVNKKSQNYLLLPMGKKMDIVRSMISKGVFRTDSSNKITPFKQIYTYEVAKNIQAYYSCDGSLVFRFPKVKTADGEQVSTAVKTAFSATLNLDLKKAINSSMIDIKVLIKPQKTKIKEK